LVPLIPLMHSDPQPDVPWAGSTALFSGKHNQPVTPEVYWLALSVSAARDLFELVRQRASFLLQSWYCHSWWNSQSHDWL